MRMCSDFHNISLPNIKLWLLSSEINGSPEANKRRIKSQDQRAYGAITSYAAYIVISVAPILLHNYYIAKIDFLFTVV